MKARQMARKINAIFSLRFNWKKTYSPVRDSKKVEQLVKKKIVSGAENRGVNIQKQTSVAYGTQFWRQSQINWDGKLLGCCVNHFKDFGNVFSDGPLNLMEADQYGGIKDVLLGNKFPYEAAPCSLCAVFESLHPTPN